MCESKNIWNPEQNNEGASMRCWTPPSDPFLFFSASRLPWNLMLECLHFSPSAGSLYVCEWMQLPLGVLSKCFASFSVDCTNTYSVMCHDLWLTICVLCFIHILLWYRPWMCGKSTNKEKILMEIVVHQLMFILKM